MTVVSWSRRTSGVGEDTASTWEWGVRRFSSRPGYEDTLQEGLYWKRLQCVCGDLLRFTLRTASYWNRVCISLTVVIQLSFFLTLEPCNLFSLKTFVFTWKYKIFDQPLVACCFGYSRWLNRDLIVFFSSTQLSVICRLAQDLREKKAAITIQRYYRGYVYRKQFMSFRRAIIKIQCFARGMFARRLRKRLLYLAKAKIIQRCWRRYQAKKRYRNYKKTIIYLQSCVRRMIARRQLKQLKVQFAVIIGKFSS